MSSPLLDELNKKVKQIYPNYKVVYNKHVGLVLLKEEKTDLLDWIIIISEDSLQLRNYDISDDLIILANSFRKEIYYISYGN